MYFARAAVSTFMEFDDWIFLFSCEFAMPAFFVCDEQLSSLLPFFTPQVGEKSNEKSHKCICTSKVIAYFPSLRGLTEV